MNQYQYQNKNPYDPFAQMDEELQTQEKFHPSSMLMRDLESYARAEQKRKTFRFRMISLVVAALILGPMSLAGRSILRGRDYNYDPDIPEEIYGYEDAYQTYDFHYEGGADDYYDPGDGELGDDLSEPELILEGTYYHLPAPLHVFIEDGWNIVYHDYEEELPAELEENWERYITLEKDGKLLQSVRIGSPSGETIPLENSYVLGFGIDKYGDIDVELPGGIRLDDDMEDVLEEVGESVAEFEYVTEEWGSEITIQKRLNTYGDYKYWKVRLSSYTDENTIDWIELTTDLYKY